VSAVLLLTDICVLMSTRPSLGTDGHLGAQLKLTDDWVARIIKLVGNYGEIFERNLDIGSKIDMTRGLNRLWNRGGIQYAPPVR
jgi:general L-amino acid transport system substrate-binding protein